MADTLSRDGALRGLRTGLIGVGLMTATINVLYLTGSFYMMEVYDRVIPGRSIPTLVGLTVLAMGLYAFQGVLDAMRNRVLVRMGMAIDARYARPVHDAILAAPLKAKMSGDGLQPLRDLDSVRAFLSGQGPSAFFDLPWIPLYLGICFLFHPYIGLAAMGGAALLVSITLFTKLGTRGAARRSVALAQQRNALVESGRRNAEAVRVLGMGPRFGATWERVNGDYMDSQGRTADVAGGFGAISKVLRMALQSGVLGLGAWLVIQGQASAGIIIASSILVSRALAPVELAIAHWRGFVNARQSWRRLSQLLAALPTPSDRLTLPTPATQLSVEGVFAAPPGSQRVVVSDATFSLKAGQALGIVGPSASGKSSLVRTIVGAWTAVRGKVRLDGAALDQWTPEALGAHLGYLPQDVELFAGTVAQNISRFDPDVTSEAVIKAGQAAGVHEMVLRFPEGYETPIGEGGTLLSAGQRQRIALARALYRDPFLLVLDEPNSNLDLEGESALSRAILATRARGGIVVLVAHRSSALAAVDTILVMVDGKVQAFGPKDEVLRSMRPAAAAGPAAATGEGAAPPLRVVKEAGAAS